MGRRWASPVVFRSMFRVAYSAVLSVAERATRFLICGAPVTRQTPYDTAVDLCQRLGLVVPYLATPSNREEEPVPAAG